MMLWAIILATAGAQSASGQNTSCPGDSLARARFTDDFDVSDRQQVDSVRRLTVAASSRSARKARTGDVVGIYFAGGAAFDNARLDSASFIRVAFGGGAEFYNTTFAGPTAFRTGCASYLDFRAARFAGPVAFSGFHIQHGLGFNEAEFRGDLILRNVAIGDTLDFSRSTFGGHVQLLGTRLPRIVDLSGVQDIAYGIDLTSGRPPDTGFVYVSLVGANLERIRIDYLRFRVSFPDSATFDERASVYERLLGRFRSEGLVQSYKILDIEYKQLRYRVERKGIRNLIQHCWWNYGYNKEYVFAWSFAFMMFFSLVTILAFDTLSPRIYRIPFLEDGDPAAQRSVGRRIVKAVMYTGVIFFGIKLDVDKFGALSWWTGYILVVYAVGLVCVAYMLAFVLNR